MTNNRDVQVAYKVKTTAPEHYRVKPTVGLIEPGQEVEVSVQLTPGEKMCVVLAYNCVFVLQVNASNFLAYLRYLFSTSLRILFWPCFLSYNVDAAFSTHFTLFFKSQQLFFDCF